MKAPQHTAAAPAASAGQRSLNVNDEQLAALQRRVVALERRRFWGYVIAIIGSTVGAIVSLSLVTLLTSAHLLAAIGAALVPPGLLVATGMVMASSSLRGIRRLADSTGHLAPLLRLPIVRGERFGRYRITEVEADRLCVERRFGYLPVAATKLLAIAAPVSFFMFLLMLPRTRGASDLELVLMVSPLVLIGVGFAMKSTPLRWSITRDVTGVRVRVEAVWMAFRVRSREIAAEDIATVFRADDSIGVYPLNPGPGRFKWITLMRLRESVPRWRTTRLEREIGRRLKLKQQRSNETLLTTPAREKGNLPQVMVTWGPRAPESE